MKIIPKEDLIIILLNCEIAEFSISDVEQIFETFGDDWHIIDGQFDKAKSNDKREKYLKQIKQSNLPCLSKEQLIKSLNN